MNSKASESKFSSYRELCVARDLEVAHCLLEDMKVCADDDVNLLCSMAADVFQKFADECRNNSELLHLLVSNVDGSQLYHLLVQCLHGALILFDKDSSIVDLLGNDFIQFDFWIHELNLFLMISNYVHFIHYVLFLKLFMFRNLLTYSFILSSFIYLIATSLEWETFEQMALWQLVAAHNIPLSLLLTLLPKLKEGQHCEALTALMMMIKHERPNNDLIKTLLACPIESLISALLSHWSSESSTTLAQILANQFNMALNLNSATLPASLVVSSGGSSSPGKRKRTTMNSLSAATGFKVSPTPGSGIDPSIELMMTHMETLRTCLSANLLTKSTTNSIELNLFHQISYSNHYLNLC